MKYADIDGLRFGLLTDDGLERRSVFDIDVDLKSSKKNVPIINTVHDPRLGTVFTGTRCTTCGQPPDRCTGHMGRIILKAPVVSSMFLPSIHKILSCICIRCAHMFVKPSNTTSGESLQVRMNGMYHQSKRVKICPKCNVPQPTRWEKWEKILVRPIWDIPSRSQVPSVTPNHIYELLTMVNNDDMSTLNFVPGIAGIDAVMMHSMGLPPILIRPSRSSRGEDDLTTRLRMILKVNSSYSDDLGECNLSLQLVNGQLTEVVDSPPDWKPQHLRNKKPVVPHHLESYFNLHRHVSGYQDVKYFIRNDHDYGRDLSSVSHRFLATKNKRGRLRANILGKRGDSNARAVASPNTFIDPDVVGVPLFICMRVTIPERVCVYNFNRLLLVLRNGPNKHPGANFLIRDGVRYMIGLFCDGGLQMGDIVHRHLTYDDVVIMNRQPSLHRYSMMAYRVRPVQSKTFQMHLSVTSAHNLDFDGDEVNLFALASLESKAEALELMSVPMNMFKSGHLLIGFVQHACLGVYQLTSSDEVVIEYENLIQLLMSSGFELSIFPLNRNYTGRSIMSMLLPTYDGKNTLDKKRLNDLVSDYLYYNRIPPAVFVGNLTRFLEAFLYQSGSTIGTFDCHVHIENSIKMDIRENMQEVEIVGTEMDVIRYTDKVRDFIGDISMSRLRQNGSKLVDIVLSGAKGNTTHITQNSGIVGQQLDILSHRPDPLVFMGTGCAERRGLIMSSFSDGLTPVEFFHHLTSSRVGLVSTAVSTSETGYCYRRISKCVEDIRIANDSRIHDSTNMLIMSTAGFDISKRLYLVTSELSFMSTTQCMEYLSNSCREERAMILRLLQHRRGRDSLRYSTYLPLPIHQLDRCMNIIDTQSQVSSTVGVEIIDSECVFMMVDTCWRSCCDVHAFPYDDPLIECLFYEHLRYDTIFVVTQGLVNRVSVLLNGIGRMFLSTLAVPGTPLGLIVSQEFSEPLTQMQLNRFHHSGESSELVDGVSRIKEILNYVKVFKSLRMTIYTKEGSKLDPRSLTQFYLCDCMSSIVDNCSVLDSREHTVVDYHILLKRDLLCSHRVVPRIVADILSTQLSNDMSIVSYTTDLDSIRWHITVRIQQCTIQHGYRILSKLMYTNTLIKGIPGIMDFYTTDKKCTYYDKSLGYLRTSTKRVIVTNGSNLEAICQVPSVDIELTSTTNLREIDTCFGIDSVCQAIENELVDIMFANSTNVRRYFIRIIARLMCKTGTPCALTFQGMSKSNTSSIKMATFERSLVSFINAGAKGHMDKLTGISESVMIGKRASVGTGSEFDLIPYNISTIPVADCIKNIPWQRSIHWSHPTDRMYSRVLSMVDKHILMKNLPVLCNTNVNDTYTQKRKPYNMEKQKTAKRPKIVKPHTLVVTKKETSLCNKSVSSVHSSLHDNILVNTPFSLVSSVTTTTNNIYIPTSPNNK